MDYSEQDNGKCLTCGFSGKLAESGARRVYYEISQSERQTKINLTTAILPSAGGVSNRHTATRLACIRAAVDLPASVNGQIEADELQRELAIRNATQKVFEEDRHCPKWHTHSPGFDPKEHLDDYRMQELEQRRRELNLSYLSLVSRHRLRAYRLPKTAIKT